MIGRQEIPCNRTAHASIIAHVVVNRGRRDKESKEICCFFAILNAASTLLLLVKRRRGYLVTIYLQVSLALRS